MPLQMLHHHNKSDAHKATTSQEHTKQRTTSVASPQGLGPRASFLLSVLIQWLADRPSLRQLTKLGRQSKGEAQVHLGPSLCMLWGLGPHGPKLPQFSPSSGPLGPRACFCSQSVHEGQWLLRGHFRLSARPSPAEGGRPDSSFKLGFRGFSPILAEQEIPRRGRGRRPLWHHRSSWGPPTAPTKGT